MVTEIFRTRLVARMEEVGFNMKSLSREAGLGETAVRDAIKRHRSPSIETAEALAKALGVSVSWLVGETSEVRASGYGGSGGEPVATAGGGSSYVELPEYDVRAAAGGGFYVDEETRKGSWPFSRSYLDELRLQPRSLVVIEVQGDSMEPTLRSGDRVMIDTSDRNPAHPGIFCLWDSDRTVVKRVEKIPASEPAILRLKSDNPLHDAYEVLAEAVNIVGRLVWFARRM